MPFPWSLILLFVVLLIPVFFIKKGNRLKAFWSFVFSLLFIQFYGSFTDNKETTVFLPIGFLLVTIYQAGKQAEKKDVSILERMLITLYGIIGMVVSISLFIQTQWT